MRPGTYSPRRRKAKPLTNPLRCGDSVQRCAHVSIEWCFHEGRRTPMIAHQIEQTDARRFEIPPAGES